jgi:hypothetical protein
VEFSRGLKAELLPKYFPLNVSKSLPWAHPNKSLWSEMKTLTGSFFTLLCLAAIQATAQSDYYVSANGSNTGNGSINSPWATIGYASTKVGPGATVHVAAGSYTGSFNTRASGTSSAPLTYVADTANFSGPVNCAQVAANHGNLSTCARLTGVGGTTWTNYGNYVRIQGFDVTGPGINGIYTEGTSTLISGNHVHDMMTSTCNSNGGSGINLNGTNAMVVGNYVHNIGPYPSACGFIQGIYFLQAGGYAYNNISFDNSGFGIQLWHYPAHISLLNNTLFKNASGGIVLGTDDNFTVDYISASNNLIAYNGGDGISEQGGSSSSVGIHNLYTNNLVYGNAGSISLMNGRTATGTVDSPPQFVNYTGNTSGNYHLTSTSPAINAATSASPSTDFDGVTRPQHNGYDIGAYEYAISSSQAPNVQLSPTSLSLPTTAKGTTSQVEYVTLSNTGNAQLAFSSNFAISGPFRFGGVGTCTMSVPAQSTCTISVVFSPTAVGQASGAVKLTDNAGTGTQIISLSGTGQ